VARLRRNAHARPEVVILHGAGEGALTDEALTDEARADEVRADEADTRVQAAAVAAALADLGHSVRVVALGLDLGRLEALAAERPALVFNLVEALVGKGQLHPAVPLALEAFGVAYTGCPAEALLTTSSKVLAKRMMAAVGLPTPDWIEPEAIAAPPRDPAARYIVKSVWEDASIGISETSVVAAAAVAATAFERQRNFGGQWFAERYVEGREFNLSLLETADGPVVLPAAEILFVDFPPGRPHIVDYEAKWDPTSPVYHNTPRRFDLPARDRRLEQELNRIALAAWHLFGLKGYARVDFRVDAAGQIWVLEVNGNPCLSPDAGYAAAAARAGLSYDALIERIVAAAWSARASLPVGAAVQPCSGSARSRTI